MAILRGGLEKKELMDHGSKDEGCTCLRRLDMLTVQPYDIV
jgi:hypothetical protein